MAAIYYYKDNQGKHYIKDINFAEGTLTFTKDSEKAYKGRDGYYANATKDLIKRNFGEDYPEVAYIECDASYF